MALVRRAAGFPDNGRPSSPNLLRATTLVHSCAKIITKNLKINRLFSFCVLQLQAYCRCSPAPGFSINGHPSNPNLLRATTLVHSCAKRNYTSQEPMNYRTVVCLRVVLAARCCCPPPLGFPTTAAHLVLIKEGTLDFDSLDLGARLLTLIMVQKLTQSL